MELWMQIALVIFVALQLVLLVGLVLNVNKILDRATAIRRQMRHTEDSGAGAQLTEAVTQLQSIAHSLDRIALRCDAVEEKLDEIAASGIGSSGVSPDVLELLREGLSDLHQPLSEIRDLLGRTETEQLSDEIKRTLHNMGYDVVTIKTDLGTLGDGEGKVQVEVSKDGASAKGYVVVRDGGVVDQKISKPYEMFP